MSDAQAKSLGYRYAAKLEGFPVYVQFNGDGPNVAGKWWFIDVLIDLHVISFVQSVRAWLQAAVDRGACTPESSSFLFSELREL